MKRPRICITEEKTPHSSTEIPQEAKIKMGMEVIMPSNCAR
jgi:hypothetical protein